MSSFPRAALPLVVLALACSGALVPGAATAAPAPRSTVPSVSSRPTAALPTVAASRRTAAEKAYRARLRQDPKVRKSATILFQKNRANPYRSTIRWRVWAKPRKGGAWVPVEEASWRAGSGFGERATDECAKGQGWTPDGVYSFVQHDRRRANLINGRVFELQSKACRNGTVRQLMFIHSEQTWDNRQCPNRKGDDGCRWEVPKVNDYRSYGCIKMHPEDLRQLTRRFHRYYAAETRYPTGVVRVRVTS